MISYGLNVRGGIVSYELNPAPTALTAIVLAVQLQEIDVEAFDGTVTLFVVEGPGFRPLGSSYHVGDGAPLVSQTPQTGLDPQPDPARVDRPEEASYHQEDGGDVVPQHTPTGLDPQADPAQAPRPDESSYHEQDGAPVSPQTPQTGLDPQPDPPGAYEPKESGSEEDVD